MLFRSDAGPGTCDWKQFQGSAPKHPWDAARFFRWRNYRDYGTGVAGDLFVHLLTGLHTVTSSTGPTRIYATGGTRYWKDRDVPDVMLATLDYPETEAHPAFNVLLRVNFKSGLPEESFGVKFIGSEGVMTTGNKGVGVEKMAQSDSQDYSINSFAEAMQKQLLGKWKETHTTPESQVRQESSQFFDTSADRSQWEHHRNFYRSIREGTPLVEDSTFGLRAAGPALLTNESLFQRKIMRWDPQNMTESKG